MLNDLDNLPTDTAELHGLVGQMAIEIKSQALLIEKIRHQVAGQNTHRFGSKGEGIDQLQLWLEDEEVAGAAAAPNQSVNHCRNICRVLHRFCLLAMLAVCPHPFEAPALILEFWVS
jgi:hypothetical protein